MALRSGIISGLISGIQGSIEANPDVPGGVATPQRQFPTSAAAWVAAFPGIATPANIWTFQEAATPVLDKVGTAHLVQNQALLYAQAGDLEPTLTPRLSVEVDTLSVNEFTAPADTTIGNIAAADSWSIYVRVRGPGALSAARGIVSKTTGTAPLWNVTFTGAELLTVAINDGTNPQKSLTSVNVHSDGAYHDVIIVVDRVGAQVRIHTDLETVTLALGTLVGVASSNALKFFSGNSSAEIGTRISYAALWPTTALTAANLTTIRTAV